jgi:hypothetical protein
VTKIVLFSRNLGMLSNSMVREEMREKEKELMNDDCEDLKHEVDSFFVSYAALYVCVYIYSNIVSHSLEDSCL